MTAYTQDLKAFLGWCQTYDRDVLRVTRGELEMYVRHLESRGYAAATIARRFGTVATFYKYAVIDGLIPANPATAVTRPKVAWEGQKRTVLHPLEFAALLAAARGSGPNDHALVCLLGMLGASTRRCANDPPNIGVQVNDLNTANTSPTFQVETLDLTANDLTHCKPAHIRQVGAGFAITQRQTLVRSRCTF